MNVSFIRCLAASRFLWGIACILVGSLGSCAQPAGESELQQHFTANLQQALGHFKRLQHADTLDFGKLTPFDWDTVYVVESYTDGYHLARDMDRKINWQAVMAADEAVPEETTRFIFVKGNEAVQYMDVSRALIGGAQFKKYYPDTPGRLTTNYFDAAGHVHPYTVNHFAKAEARFILVCNVTIPTDSTGRNAYLPLRLLQDKWFIARGIRPTNLVDLHPLSGCGIPTCWANDSVYEAAKAK
jgi:hypothetical protein